MMSPSLLASWTDKPLRRHSDLRSLENSDLSTLSLQLWRMQRPQAKGLKQLWPRCNQFGAASAAAAVLGQMHSISKAFSLHQPT